VEKLTLSFVSLTAFEALTDDAKGTLINESVEKRWLFDKCDGSLKGVSLSVLPVSAFVARLDSLASLAKAFTC